MQVAHPTRWGVYISTSAGTVPTEALINGWERSTDRAIPLTDTDVRAAIAHAGGLIGLLPTADRVERAARYRALGLTLRYVRRRARTSPTGNAVWSHTTVAAILRRHGA